MPRAGQVIFSDIAYNLDMLRVECPRCGRAGLTALDRAFDLGERRGINVGHTVRVLGMLSDFFQQLLLGCSFGGKPAINSDVLAANSESHDVPPLKSPRRAVVISLIIPNAVKE